MADESSDQELYQCNGCLEKIPAHRARVSCHSCPDYHLCANCFVIKQYTKPHADSHATLVLKKSGVVVPLPPGFTPRPAPALPPRQNSTINTRQTARATELPTANWGALWNVLKAPLEKKDKRGRIDATVKSDGLNDMREGSTSSMMSGANGSGVKDLPPSPPQYVTEEENYDNQIPSYPQPAEWEALFEADSTPTPIFIAFMSTIFGHLDPKHAGYLAPEVYSDFLDVQGYELASNIWKYAFESDGGEQSRDVADLELGLYYADLNISHTLKVRPKYSPLNSSIDEPSSAVEERIKDSLRFSANMPMLSRQGFIDLGAIEYLRDPSKGYIYLKAVVAKYSVWTDLGEIPRNVLPESSISKSLLANKMEAEPENTIPKVLLAEKLVREEEKEIESDNQNGYVSEELNALPPSLPMRVKGGEAKVEALLKNEKFDEVDEIKKSDAKPEVSENEA